MTESQIQTETHNAEIEILADHWRRIVPGASITIKQRNTLHSLLSKFTVEGIISAMDTAASQFIKIQDGHPTDISTAFAFGRITGLCVKERAFRPPDRVARIAKRIFARLRRQIPTVSFDKVQLTVRCALEGGMPQKYLILSTCNVTSFNEWRSIISSAPHLTILHDSTEEQDDQVTLKSIRNCKVVRDIWDGAYRSLRWQAQQRGMARIRAA